MKTFASFAKKFCACLTRNPTEEEDLDAYYQFFAAHGIEITPPPQRAHLGKVAPQTNTPKSQLELELYGKIREFADTVKTSPKNSVHGAVFAIPREESELMEDPDLQRLLDEIQRMFDMELGYPAEREVLSMDLEIVRNEDIPDVIRKYEERLKREFTAHGASPEWWILDRMDTSDALNQILNIEISKREGYETDDERPDTPDSP
ncbi:hypothetical protein L596_024645 [Steinernema carpocapsae]|uniref:Uncharacterized protein n=1 Tax=Steinernema carpocapsae TaxID=34508 RepID=A0A4U5M5C0_STECR|nr:hypothetical protein L596_024645 [Steinernema carpocapsae]